MRFPKCVILIALTSVLLTAQDKPQEKTEQPKYEAVIIPVKTLSGDSFNRMVRMLNVFNAPLSADEKLRTILVYASPNIVEQIRRVVSQLDRPGSEAAIGRNIEMNLTFLRCWPKAPSSVVPLPVDLVEVAKQLRAATQYKDIEVWDSLPLRLQEGKDTDQSLLLPITDPRLAGVSATAQIHIHPDTVSFRDTGRYVRFEKLNIGFRVPVLQPGQGQLPPGAAARFNYMDVGLSTAGEFKEGQKSVLGKLSGVENDSAIFVVISLKVVE